MNFRQKQESTASFTNMSGSAPRLCIKHSTGCTMLGWFDWHARSTAANWCHHHGRILENCTYPVIDIVSASTKRWCLYYTTVPTVRYRSRRRAEFDFGLRPVLLATAECTGAGGRRNLLVSFSGSRPTHTMLHSLPARSIDPPYLLVDFLQVSRDTFGYFFLCSDWRNWSEYDPKASSIPPLLRNCQQRWDTPLFYGTHITHALMDTSCITFEHVYRNTSVYSWTIHFDTVGAHKVTTCWNVHFGTNCTVVERKAALPLRQCSYRTPEGCPLSKEYIFTVLYIIFYWKCLSEVRCCYYGSLWFSRYNTNRLWCCTHIIGNSCFLWVSLIKNTTERYFLFSQYWKYIFCLYLSWYLYLS